MSTVFEKILSILSRASFNVNNGKYTTIVYRIMAIKPFLDELCAEIEPQKSFLQYGVVKLTYREEENRVYILITSIEAWKFAQIVGKDLKKEKIKYAVAFHNRSQNS